MVGEAIKLKCPASSPVNKEKRKLLKKRNARFVLNQPLLMHQSAYGVRSINQHTGYSKFSNEQCEVIANLYIPNIFLLLVSSSDPCYLWCYDGHAVFDPKLSLLEKSVSEI